MVRVKATTRTSCMCGCMMSGCLIRTGRILCGYTGYISNSHTATDGQPPLNNRNTTVILTGGKEGTKWKMMHLEKFCINLIDLVLIIHSFFNFMFINFYVDAVAVMN